MNIVKLTSRILMLLFLLLSFNVSADSAKSVNSFIVLEVERLKIKLSNDGTGIVKGIPCPDCNTHYLKITKNTKAGKNGVEIDIQQAKQRAGKSVGVSFDPKTREVQFIYWYE